MSINLSEQEFMSLADGVGCVPDKFRNRAYSKLDFGPGEGGIGTAASGRGASTDTGAMTGFLAAVAAGADPQEYAQQVLNGDTTTPPTRRPRRTRETS